MNLDLLQIVFGALAFVSFVMAARTGLSTEETKAVKKIITHDTQFIHR